MRNDERGGEPPASVRTRRQPPERRGHLHLDIAQVEHAIRNGFGLLPGWRLLPVVGKVPARGFLWGAWATADLDDRRRYAETFEHDGWAVATDAEHCVVDMDVKPGFSGIESYCALGDLTPPGVVGATPGGGRHFHFGNIGALGNAVGVLPGVDFRGVGGYAVIAGPGRRLSWERPWPVELPELPQEVVELLAPRVPLLGLPDVLGRQNLRGALLGACERVAAAVEGERNHVLNWASFVAGREAIAGGARRAGVEAVLLRAASLCGLGEAEAMRTIRSGLGVV